MLGREYVWLDDRPLAVVANAGTAPVIWHVHTDQLERPVMMTDDTKAVVWQAIWLPFGGAHSIVSTITGPAVLDRRFPGQWFQLESGLYYNWHRHYDPTTGRYVQPDPLGMPDGPNRFAYVNNSPLMYVDPKGLAEIPTPPPNIPGGPWTENPGQRPGNFLGPKSPGGGGRGELQWVPSEKEGGPGGSKGYWKTKKPGGPWGQRYNRQGQPISPGEAHPGNPSGPKIIGPRPPIWYFLPNPCVIEPGLPYCPNPNMAGLCTPNNNFGPPS